MALNLLKDTGVPLEQQRFTWRELVQPPYSKLDDDAFTRVRVILMNGIESEVLRFGHACVHMNSDLQLALARVRRIEQHQQTLVNWLNPADQSPLETTIGFEQVAIEVTASVAESGLSPWVVCRSPPTSRAREIRGESRQGTTAAALDGQARRTAGVRALVDEKSHQPHTRSGPGIRRPDRGTPTFLPGHERGCCAHEGV
jgi:hypothetical protein